MNTSYETRFACSPGEFERMDGSGLRSNFLIQDLFSPNHIRWTYSHFDRFMVGAVLPIGQAILLETIDPLKAEFFLERRELGVINIGGKGGVEVDDEKFILENKEAIYIGKGNKKVIFTSVNDREPAKFYMNAAPAHKEFPTRKITKKEAESVELGSPDSANYRVVNKLLVASVIQTCQLQMGMTELKKGSIWNTMPPHTHDRRMEVYLYFDLPQGHSVCHFMGRPTESRHMWMQNEEAVIVPPWSIHCGAGTNSYSFIWGMAGENLDYGDMDACAIADLK